MLLAAPEDGKFLTVDLLVEDHVIDQTHTSCVYLIYIDKAEVS